MKKHALTYALLFLLASPFLLANNSESSNAETINIEGQKQVALEYISLTFENDAYFRDDGIYTNGTFLNWGYHDVALLDKATLPIWISFLAQYTHLKNSPGKLHDISYSIGQILQTPVDFENEALIKNDVPYVGLFAWNGRIQSFDDVIDDQMALTLGVVGPIAGGETSQKSIHGVIGSPEPMGWDHQIENEVVVRLATLRKWRLYEKRFTSTEFDFISGIGGGLGNLKSDVSAGVTARWGTSLQKSYSSAPVFSTQQFNSLKPNPFGWYLFTNLASSYVFNDIFMDGNTFQDSHRVDLIHEQVALSFGMMANFDNWNLIYSNVILSDQYKEQAELSRFGAITISYQF